MVNWFLSSRELSGPSFLSRGGVGDHRALLDSWISGG